MTLTKTRLAAYLLGSFLGGLFTPDLVLATRNWVGGIVIEALHQHWQWEQVQLQGGLKLIPNGPDSRG